MSKDMLPESMDYESDSFSDALEIRYEGDNHDQCPSEGDSKVLNASFDASLLRPSAEDFVPRSTQSVRAAASWDERDVASASHPNGTHPSHLDMPELPPSSTTCTARKMRLSTDVMTSEGTPVRLRFRPPGTARKQGKLTPVSAKRRKAPVHHHHHPTRARSPLHRGGSKPSRVSATGSAITARTLPNETPFPLSGTMAPAAHQHLHQKLGSQHSASGITLAMETTSETIESSADASIDSSTPFHFTSFPASLPRVNNLPLRHAPSSTVKEISSGVQTESICGPPSVRKRMSFGSVLTGDRSGHNATASQDTSFSSLPLDSGDENAETHHRSGMNPQHLVAEASHADHPADTSTTGTGTPVPRARLNFSSVTSPKMNDALDHREEHATQLDRMGLCGPYEAGRASSFASSVSSMKNEDTGFPSLQPTSTGMTPLRTPAAVFLPSSAGSHTPREVNLHFQLDAAQCSPIPGIPEEDGDLSSTKSGCRFPSTKQPHDSSSRRSTSRDSTSTDRSENRRMSRPMPDMSAFEGDASSSSRERSFDESNRSAGSKQPASPRLLCPPTPIRTPAWAQSEEGGASVFKLGGLKRCGRSNSLIVTKVLATCSPHVLDGRASLESSLGDSRESQGGQSKNGDLSDDDTIVEEAADATMAPAKFNWLHDARVGGSMMVNEASHALRRESFREAGESVSMGSHFEILSTLGSGNFADCYRVRSKLDGRLYAIKRNRRQFRGTRDREKALAEVKCMQRLQNFEARHDDHHSSNYSLYILLFYQAWQEDGHFFCQTELCCRDTIRDLHESLRSNWSVAKTRYPSLSKLPVPVGDFATMSSCDGRLFPEQSLWKILHDVSAGLSHIHSHGLVHFDIKPSNLFLVPHARLGAMTKIGDFGMAGEIGSSEDGQEGDQKYMAVELLSSDRKHPSADIFSLGLTLFELASEMSFTLPSEGARWHQLRSGLQLPFSGIPSCRTSELTALLRSMLSPRREERPTADSILQGQTVKSAGSVCDEFVRDYLLDIEEYDRREEQRIGFALQEDQTPRHAHATGRSIVCSPTASFLPKPPILSSPEAAPSC